MVGLFGTAVPVQYDLCSRQCLSHRLRVHASQTCLWICAESRKAQKTGDVPPAPTLQPPGPPPGSNGMLPPPGQYGMPPGYPHVQGPPHHPPPYMMGLPCVLFSSTPLLHGCSRVCTVIAQ